MQHELDELLDSLLPKPEPPPSMLPSRARDFENELRARDILRRRQPLPGGAETSAAPLTAPVELGGQGVVRLVVGDEELGELTYRFGPFEQMYLSTDRWDAAPWVEGLLQSGRNVLTITGFHSWREKATKGIGKAMLRRMVELAEGHDCDYVLVIAGVNPQAYEALGFQLLDKFLMTWGTPTSKLRALVARSSGQRAGRWNEAP